MFNKTKLRACCNYFLYMYIISNGENFENSYTKILHRKQNFQNWNFYYFQTFPRIFLVSSSFSTPTRSRIADNLHEKRCLFVCLLWLAREHLTSMLYYIHTVGTVGASIRLTLRINGIFNTLSEASRCYGCSSHSFPPKLSSFRFDAFLIVEPLEIVGFMINKILVLYRVVRSILICGWYVSVLWSLIIV